MDRPPRAKIKLVSPTEAHYRVLYPQRYQPEVLRWADDWPTIPELPEFLERRRSRQADPTCIERVILADGAPIGTVTAFGINRFSRDCELGIVLVDPASWGKGIGPYAMRQFFRILDRIGIDIVNLETFLDNTRAQNAFRKVGFVVRNTYWDRELGRDIVVMSLELARLADTDGPPPDASGPDGNTQETLG